MARDWLEGEFERWLNDIATRIAFIKNSENVKPLKVGDVITIKLKSGLDA